MHLLHSFITVRVGKAAAFAVGGSVLLLQVAHHQGYIKVNWDKVYKHVDKVADKVEKEATGQSPKWMEKIREFTSANSFIAVSYVGGLLIGIATG
uniref:Uncharacterized protein n=1 Tax=Timema monikensis TaxID=170555 RepID=A0A7R9EFH0_9NEOP|nr:unnamed protein product [Timema monikensis]